MSVKSTISTLAEKFEEHKGLLSSALTLWGLSALTSGIVTAYTSTAFVMENQALRAVPYLLAPYLLNILGGIFNLLFGVTLVAFARKISK